MNKISLQHNYMQNQVSSWIDDPFDLKGTFAGVASLSNEKTLYNYAEELVSRYAQYIDDQFELPLEMLPDDEQNELARLYLEFTDRDLSECIYGNDLSIESEFTCAILSILKNDCQQTREVLSTIVRKNILTYYSEALQGMLDDACETHLSNEMEEAGFHSSRDLDSGEVVWGKF